MTRGVRRPLTVKVLEGERRDRINVHEPTPEQAPPIPPEVFTDEQRAVWDRIVETLTERGMAYRCDSEAIASLAYSEWVSRDCIRRINEVGLLVRGSNGEPKPNPLLAVMHRAEARCLVQARTFGLTPRSRDRLLPGPGDA